MTTIDPKFPELKRLRQQLSRAECVEVLTHETRGVLSLIGANGYPYALPINHFFAPTEETLYFHCGKIGYKLDCIASCPRACFTVTERGDKKEGEWWYTVRSVIAFGKVEILNDPLKVADISRKLASKFTNDREYVEEEIRNYLKDTILLALSVEHLSGKRVREK